ncbi:MAG: GAF domain-containing protein [Halovenus sp.]
MTHSICTQSQGIAYFQELWEIMFAPDTDLGSRLERLFERETAAFGLEYGFFSRIDTEAEMQYFQVVHGSHENLQAGDTVPLPTTYCRKTITEPDGVLAISNAVADGWADDPAYRVFNLGSYIGTTVSADGDLYGTLCFANTAPRHDPITDQELALLEMYSQWVSHELNQWRGPPAQDVASLDLEGHDISLSRMNTLMEVLGNEVRRLIVLSLLDDSTENILELLERETDIEHVETTLRHIHLPKLEEAGYVELSPDLNTIYPGPDFSEIEPFLRQLDEYQTD